jgi:hypothetical protein
MLLLVPPAQRYLAVRAGGASSAVAYHHGLIGPDTEGGEDQAEGRGRRLAHPRLAGDDHGVEAPGEAGPVELSVLCVGRAVGQEPQAEAGGGRSEASAAPSTSECPARCDST